MSKQSKRLAKGRPLQMKCPYCGKSMHYRSADGIYNDNYNKIMLYACSGYPACDAYVRADKETFKPLGVPANGDLRAMRIETHRVFDKLWRTGYMTRTEAYYWLMDVTGLPKNKAHISMFRELMCQSIMKKTQLALVQLAERDQCRPLDTRRLKMAL